MKPKLYFLAVLFLAYLRTFQINAQRTAEEGEEFRESIQVSPECAVVLITAGSAVGGVTSWALTGPLLSLVGFSAAGVTKGSFAAYWQSTLPLIQAGTLFSSLQSIAMAGVGSSILITSSVGGAITARQLTNLCQKIDSVEKESPEGKVIASLLKAEGKYGVLWKKFREDVVPNIIPSDETKERLWEDWEKVKVMGAGEWNRFKEKVLPNIIPSEDTQQAMHRDWEKIKEYGTGEWNRVKKDILPSEKTQQLWWDDLKDLKGAYKDVWEKMKDRRRASEEL